jgi:hypothetical protein
MLTDFVVADRSEAEAVSSSTTRSSTWPCFESKGLDNSVLAALWSALDPSADSGSLEGEKHLIFTKGNGGPWVFNVPTALVTGLSALSPGLLLQVAERWVEQPELKPAGWQALDVAPAIEALSAIASTAISKKKCLLLWMSL